MKSLSPIAPGHGQASVQICWSTISVYCPAKFKLASIFYPFIPGILTFPSQANLKRDDCPLLELTKKPIIINTKKAMLTMKAMIPYGTAKQNYFFHPVKHPKHATISAITPIAMLPIPIPAPSLIPGILKASAF